MKKCLFLLFLGMNSIIYAQNSQEFTDFKGDYLGQTPPGDTPVVFAPGIVSTPLIEHSAPTFSRDGKEIYWSVIRISNDSVYQQIMFTKYVDGKWTVPSLAPFSNGKFYEGGPVISADDSRLYIYRGKPAPPGGNADSINIICYTRQGDEWVEPEIISKGAFHSIAKNGNIYCNVFYNNDHKIYKILYENNEYLSPSLLNESINQKDCENWTPFVSPDESYIIFSRMDFKGDYGELMIAFRDNKTGEWSEPINMGEPINTWSQERFPAVSPDGKYLFFTRWADENNNDIYWLSAEVIDRLREKNSKKE
jgi:Tol biopolymer transport system component